MTFTKLDQAGLDSPRRGLFNGGLGIAATLLVRWQTILCVLLQGAQSSCMWNRMYHGLHQYCELNREFSIFVKNLASLEDWKYETRLQGHKDTDTLGPGFGATSLLQFARRCPAHSQRPVLQEPVPMHGSFFKVFGDPPKQLTCKLIGFFAVLNFFVF